MSVRSTWSPSSSPVVEELGLGRIRIIGGQWRGRLISVPAQQGVRPTPDRVRETLFNWLGQDLSGTTCLDLFAGSGALGFEAASRGAQRVTLVDRERRAFKLLCENARRLDAARFELVCADALQFVAAVRSRYDLMFLDPPYRQDWLERLSPLLPHALQRSALVYAEAEQRIERIGDWRTIKYGRAGQVHYHLLQAQP